MRFESNVDTDNSMLTIFLMQGQKGNVIVSSVDMIRHVERAELRKKRPRIPDQKSLEQVITKC